jgi:hypothetical protein
VLQGVRYRRLDGRRLRDDGFGCNQGPGRSVEPCWTGGIGRPLRRECRGVGFGDAATLGEALGLLVVEVVLGAAAASRVGRNQRLREWRYRSR